MDFSVRLHQVASLQATPAFSQCMEKGCALPTFHLLHITALALSTNP